MSSVRGGREPRASRECGVVAEIGDGRGMVAGLSEMLLVALEVLGPRGRELARKAGEAEGRRLACGGGRTIGEALAPLQSIGVVLEIEGNQVAAGLRVFRDSERQPPEVVRALQKGLLQGALDGAGLAYSVRAGRRREGWLCGYRACPRPAARPESSALTQHHAAAPLSPFEASRNA